MATRILVCGGRDFADRDLLFAALDAITPRTEPDEHGNDMPKDVTIIHGKCPTGADSFADDWAVVNWCGLETFKADWDRHKRAAGPIRNSLMLKDGKPDFVLAFPGGRGTDDMVSKARKASVQVYEPAWCPHPGVHAWDPNCVDCLNRGVIFK